MSDVQVTEVVNVELITPYAGAKVINEFLIENGYKSIPPQMVYNYVKKGYIVSTDGKVTVNDLAEWATKYLAKKDAKAAAKVQELKN